MKFLTRHRALLLAVALIGAGALLVVGLFFSSLNSQKPNNRGSETLEEDAESASPSDPSVDQKNTAPGTPPLRFIDPAGEPAAVSAMVGTPGKYPPDEVELAAGDYYELPEPQETTFAGKDLGEAPVAHEVLARSKDGRSAAWVEVAPAERYEAELHTINLEAARALQVEVVDANDEPVVGADVRLSRGLVGLIHLLAEVDEEASVDFWAIPAGDFQISVKASGFVGQTRHFLHTNELTDDKKPNRAKFVMDRGATLSGRVVDGAGRGVSGATVEVIPVSPFAEEVLDAEFLARVGVASQRGESDNDGRFSLGGVSAGAAQVRAEAPGWSSGLSGLVRVKQGQRHDVGDIVVDAQGSGEELLVRVETTDPEVKLSAVELLAEGEDGADRRCRGSLMRAADWRFPNCGVGTRTLIATTTKGVKLKWRGEFTETTEVRLDAPASLELFAVDQSGAPVTGAFIEVWEGDKLVFQGESRGHQPVRYQAALPFSGALFARDARLGAGGEPIAIEAGEPAPVQGVRRYVAELNAGLLSLDSPAGDVRDAAQIEEIIGVELVEDGRQVLFDMVPPDSPGAEAGLERGDSFIYLRPSGSGYKLAVSRAGAQVFLDIHEASD